MYSNAHKLKLIRQVCDLYRQHKREGLSTIYIYRKVIYPQYPMSLSTFYNYLQTPVGQLERELEEQGRTTLS